MRPLVIVLTMLALAPVACARRDPADGVRATRPERRTDLLTAADFGSRDWANVHEIVSTLRPNWLNLRGSDTILGEPTNVQVLLDGVPLGDVTVLRTQPAVGVQYLQYYDPISAAARWGMGYGKGAIYISMRQP